MASEEAEAAAPTAFEVWNDYDPSMRFVTAYPMSAAQGTESSTVAYYAFEPGQHSGLHFDDAEELIYVADGEGEVFVSGVQQKLEAGGFNFVPKGVQHDVYAYGDVALRLLSFFPSARVESTFTEILLPFHTHRSPRTCRCRRRCRRSRRSRSTSCRRASPRRSAGRRTRTVVGPDGAADGEEETATDRRAEELSVAVVSMMRFAGDPDELFAKVRDHVDPVTAGSRPGTAASGTSSRAPTTASS